MIGRTIGNYVVRAQIGEGGMGVVYLAEHPRIKRQVAIKVLLPEYTRNPIVVTRFFNEARAANEIRNEHIIDIIDFGELPDDGASYIIMEWLDGRSVGAELGHIGRYPVERAVHIAKGIARALAGAHAHGIVHRDLKPDNIFLIRRGDDPDFVKVLDFGIAKLTIPAGDPSEHVKTQTGAIIGTPSYMSPEQCRGLPIDQRTDIYALGCILYQMLTGQLPFDAPALGELLLKHMTEVPQSPKTLVPSLPTAIEAAVMKALEKDPDKRFQRVEELLAALSGVETGPFPVLQAPVLATTTALPAQPQQDTIGAAAGQTQPVSSAGSKLPPQAGGRKGLAIAGALAAVVAVGSAAVVMTRGSKPAAPAEPVTSAAAPTPAAAPPRAPAPVTPPPAAPATAHLSIRTVPASAELFLDDAPVANPFVTDVPRGTVEHHLVAKAAGHQSESQWITFAADRELELTLPEEHATTGKPASTHHAAKAPVALPKLDDHAQPAATRPAPTVAQPAPATKPAGAQSPTAPAGEKNIYKGTKGKLITDFPSE